MIVGDRLPIEKAPGFYSRSNGIEFRFTDKYGRRRWRRARTLPEARRLKAQLETDVARGEYRDVSKVTVKEYGSQWIRTYKGRTSEPIREHSRWNLERRLVEAYEFFGDMRMVEVEPRDIKSYAAWVAGRPRRGKRGRSDTRPLSANTVRLTLAPIKAMFATAFEEGIVRVNPAAGVRVSVPKTRRVDEDGPVKAMTEAELASLLQAIAARAPDRLLFFRVLAALGLRISEAAELRWRDVDLGQKTVKVRRVCYDGKVGPPKSKNAIRTLKLTPELAQALWPAAAAAKPDELLFPNEDGGWLNPSNLMARTLKPAAADAGLGEWVKDKDGVAKAVSWVGFHTFRHTCATLLFSVAKWNPKQVQTWLGHHSAAFTVDTYVHLLSDALPDPPNLGGIEFGTSFGTNEEGTTVKTGVSGP